MKLTRIVKICANLSRVNVRALNDQYFNPNFGTCSDILDS